MSLRTRISSVMSTREWHRGRTNRACYIQRPYGEAGPIGYIHLIAKSHARQVSAIYPSVAESPQTIHKMPVYRNAMNPRCNVYSLASHMCAMGAHLRSQTAISTFLSEWRHMPVQAAPSLTNNKTYGWYASTLPTVHGAQYA